MTELNGSITGPDLKRVSATLRTVDKGLAAEWRREAKSEVAAPWALELGGFAPYGTLGQAARRSIKPSTGQLPAIRAGVGSWNGWQPFFALDHGMSHEAYHTYLRRSKRGRRHIVRRRVGRWAPEHRGSYSYWLEPGIAKTMDKYRERVIGLMDGFIRRRL